jgi:hypothetical protein
MKGMDEVAVGIFDFTVGGREMNQLVKYIYS